MRPSLEATAETHSQNILIKANLLDNWKISQATNPLINFKRMLIYNLFYKIQYKKK